jgi:ubiquitin C-terminal hydrolase
MNATLQCLLHVSELIVYFIKEFPKDQETLNRINKSIPSGGDISRVFYNLVIGVYDNPINMKNSRKNLKPQTNVNIKKSLSIFNDLSDNLFGKDNNNAFSPKDFKKALGLHNPQFKAFEANDSKDLILYLLQTLHEEMNYFGDKKIRLNYYPNQYDMFNTYQHFYTTYNSNNFSKISLLFYGTYINTTVCKKCNLKLYNFQKFEFISFGMYFYNNKEFNIMKGFEDNSKTGLLTGDNKFLCNNCKGLQDAETTCQIFEPPNKLLINIDYGKNKKYQPSSIKFDEEIDITPFIASNLNIKFQYRIIGVCTHYGYSGRYGHYVAFCRHREEKVWYEFNDSIVSKCSQKDIYRGSPYLLLYERII